MFQVKSIQNEREVFDVKFEEDRRPGFWGVKSIARHRRRQVAGDQDCQRTPNWIFFRTYQNRIHSRFFKTKFWNSQFTKFSSKTFNNLRHGSWGPPKSDGITTCEPAKNSNFQKKICPKFKNPQIFKKTSSLNRKVRLKRKVTLLRINRIVLIYQKER